MLDPHWISNSAFSISKILVLICSSSLHLVLDYVLISVLHDSLLVKPECHMNKTFSLFTSTSSLFTFRNTRNIFDKAWNRDFRISRGEAWKKHHKARPWKSVSLGVVVFILTNAPLGIVTHIHKAWLCSTSLEKVAENNLTGSCPAGVQALF